MWARLGITSAVVAVVLTFQVWNLIRYVERSNRDVRRFLDGVKEDDFSQSFADDGRGGTHKELRRALRDVLARFRRVRAEREESLRYLSTVITHVDTGLIAVTPDGKIELINPAARRVLDLGSARDLRDLARRSEPLAAAIEGLPPGQRMLLPLDRDGETAQLSIAATELKIRSRVLKLVSLRDISRELDARELAAWQQQGRVLSHEIVNSVTPVASLATTARELLDAVGAEKADGTGYRMDAETYSDLNDVVETIAERSQGLVRFVEAYRRLTRLPAPRFEVSPLSDLLLRVRQLLAARPDARSVRFAGSVEPDCLEITADVDLVEQALLNIGINAVQALQGRPDGVIELSGRLGPRGRVVVEVADNGPGISPAALEKVFVPFFTTREGGTGIGLSLARQIVRLHGGDITATSAPGERTVLTLRF
jgi:nitrogen fixation/metabolism regulation signal transduction histidine kinase